MVKDSSHLSNRGVTNKHTPCCFSLLVGAIQTAGMTELLNQQGELTFFAPTNNAFTAINQLELNRLMREFNIT